MCRAAELVYVRCVDAVALLHARTSITDERSNGGNHPCRTSLKPSMPFSRSVIQHTRICSCILQHAHTPLVTFPIKSSGCSSASWLLLSSPRNSYPHPHPSTPTQEPFTFCISLFYSLFRTPLAVGFFLAFQRNSSL